jgi:hypothetical protein
MTLPPVVQNRTERQEEESAINLLKEKCENYTTAKYSDIAQKISDEIKILLEGLRLDQGYNPLMENLENQRQKNIKEKKTKVIKKDERSLSKILNDAVHHYNLYQLYNSKEEKLSYLAEIDLLKQNLIISSTKTDQINRRGLIERITNILEIYDPSNYSPSQVDSLAFVIDYVENADINLFSFKFCIDKLKKAYHQI